MRQRWVTCLRVLSNPSSSPRGEVIPILQMQEQTCGIRQRPAARSVLQVGVGLCSIRTGSRGKCYTEDLVLGHQAVHRSFGSLTLRTLPSPFNGFFRPPAHTEGITHAGGGPAEGSGFPSSSSLSYFISDCTGPRPWRVPRAVACCSPTSVRGGTSKSREWGE